MSKIPTHTPGPLPFGEIRCPFKDEARCRQFAAMLSDYRGRNSALFNRIKQRRAERALAKLAKQQRYYERALGIKA